MKRFLVIASSFALGFVVLSGTQIEKGPTGLTLKSGQAQAADIVKAPPRAPAPAPVGKGKAPIFGGKGKAPVVTARG